MLVENFKSISNQNFQLKTPLVQIIDIVVISFILKVTF